MGARIGLRGIQVLMLFLTAALFALAPAVAQAVSRPPPIVPSYLTQSAIGPHFVVHYTPDQGGTADRLSAAGANVLLANAETGYAWEVSLQGYPAPADAGDGKTDIYVFNTPPGLGGAATGPDTNADKTTGFILLSPANAVNGYAVFHEFFHVIQMGIYQHMGFFTESTAEWAGQAVVAANGGAPPPNWYPNPQVPLDCLGSSCTGDHGGYHGSIFWEYLSERFGVGLPHEALARDAALAAAAGDHQPHDLQALGEVLTAHGSSIADAFEGYAIAAVAGQITRPGVLPHVPVAEFAFIADMPISYAPSTLLVDHLALKSIFFVGAEPGSTAKCAPVTLHLEVGLPPGVPTLPFFVVYPPTATPPATAIYRLAISGATATADVPWQTCTEAIGSLTLPNASTASDGQAFTVHVTVRQSARLKRPRLRGRASQDIDKLTVRVHSVAAAKLTGQASVKLLGTRALLKSRLAKARVGANRTVTLHLRFAQPKLKKIKAMLAAGKHPTAKIRVAAGTAAGESATATKKVKLKP